MSGSQLDGVLPNLKPISQAPRLSELEALAEKLQQPLEQIISEERKNRYKAIDSQGNVFIMANPALAEIDRHGKIHREKPAVFSQASRRSRSLESNFARREK